MIIVDTGFWLALANQDDKHHTKARQVMQNLREPLITTWFVFTAICYLLLTRLGNHSQVLFRVCRIKAEPLSDKLFSHFEHD